MRRNCLSRLMSSSTGARRRIRRFVECAAPPFVRFTRDGHVNPVAAQPAANPPAAIGFVTDDPLWPEPGPTRSDSPHDAPLHQRLEGAALVLLAGLEHKGHWSTVCLLAASGSSG